jgi:hypothetical protein
VLPLFGGSEGRAQHYARPYLHILYTKASKDPVGDASELDACARVNRINRVDLEAVSLYPAPAEEDTHCRRVDILDEVDAVVLTVGQINIEAFLATDAECVVSH